MYDLNIKTLHLQQLRRLHSYGNVTQRPMNSCVTKILLFRATQSAQED